MRRIQERMFSLSFHLLSAPKVSGIWLHDEDKKFANKL
jgi:hypothetical protein